VVKSKEKKLLILDLRYHKLG